MQKPEKSRKTPHLSPRTKQATNKSTYFERHCSNWTIDKLEWTDDIVKISPIFIVIGGLRGPEHPYGGSSSKKIAISSLFHMRKGVLLSLSIGPVQIDLVTGYQVK